MRFSARFEASKGKRALILEDAPRPTRIGFIKGFLCTFVGTDDEYNNSRKEPLETRQVHNAFITLIRDEADPWDYDEQSELGALTHHIKECSWAEFFDFVELLGALLIRKEADGPFDDPEYFKEYQAKVNALFQEDGIGWVLNDKSELYRQVPKDLAKRVTGSESMLTDRFDAARTHYQKARAYLYQHPIDEANSIKEIVSALESVSRVIFPKASTLGEAVKQMRKNLKYSPQLVDAMEKLYTFSNATPLVRHGHPKAGSIKLPEAELAFFMGTSFIRYLIDMEKQGA
jgi:hypothetical protein